MSVGGRGTRTSRVPLPRTPGASLPWVGWPPPGVLRSSPSSLPEPLGWGDRASSLSIVPEPAEAAPGHPQCPAVASTTLSSQGMSALSTSL